MSCPGIGTLDFPQFRLAPSADLLQSHRATSLGASPETGGPLAGRHRFCGEQNPMHRLPLEPVSKVPL